jgi:hypothetical protein
MKTLMFYLSLYRLNRYGRSPVGALIHTLRRTPF